MRAPEMKTQSPSGSRGRAGVRISNLPPRILNCIAVDKMAMQFFFCRYQVGKGSAGRKGADCLLVYSIASPLIKWRCNSFSAAIRWGKGLQDGRAQTASWGFSPVTKACASGPQLDANSAGWRYSAGYRTRLHAAVTEGNLPLAHLFRLRERREKLAGRRASFMLLGTSPV